MKRITGAITAIVTPFDASGAVDTTSLKNIVSFQLAGGINGIVPCGSTGEAATLSLEEYGHVIKTVVAVAGGKVPIIAGAGSNDTQKAVLFSRTAKQNGADALLHVTPYYNKPSVNGLIAHFSEVAKQVDLPIILYNVPGRTGANMSAKTTIAIAKEIPQVIGIKEASANILQMMEIKKNASKNFSLLSGDDAMTLPIMAIGGVGCISVVANEMPKEFTALVSAALEGNWKKAKKIHYILLDMMNVNFIETNPLPVKTALFYMGKIAESFRLPLVPMEERNKKQLRTVLKENGLV